MTWKYLGASALAAATLGVGAPTTWAQEPYVGEIKITANTYCPTGWVEANGQKLIVDEYYQLFLLYSDIYGGDKRVDFAVPDLRGRTPMGRGDYGGRTYQLGQYGGLESTRMTIETMPTHSHRLYASSSAPTSTQPTGNHIATFPEHSRVDFYGSATPGVKTMSSSAIGVSQGSAAYFAVRQPGLGMRFCIAADGAFPSRN